MISVSESNGSTPSPRQGHCVVFWGKALLSQCLSSLRCTNGSNNPAELKSNKMVATTRGRIQTHKGVAILFVPSCYGNQDNSQHFEPVSRMGIPFLVSYT